MGRQWAQRLACPVAGRAAWLRGMRRRHLCAGVEDRLLAGVVQHVVKLEAPVLELVVHALARRLRHVHAHGLRRHAHRSSTRRSLRDAGRVWVSPTFFTASMRRFCDAKSAVGRVRMHTCVGNRSAFAPGTN
jgi:hypothetical protein